jgi:hypothetical protein
MLKQVMHVLIIILQRALNSHIVTNPCMNVEFRITAYKLTFMDYKYTTE